MYIVFEPKRDTKDQTERDAAGLLRLVALAERRFDMGERRSDN